MIIAVCELLFIMIVASAVVTQVILPLWQGTSLFPLGRRRPRHPERPPAPPAHSDLWIDQEGIVRRQTPGERADD